MTLTELAIKRPSFIVVIFTVLSVLGFISFSQLKYELLPKMSNPMVTIATVYPGASPQEVETSVSKLIEDAVSGLDKVKAVRATSQENISFVMVEFDQSAKVDFALQDAQRKVNEIVSKLPEGVKPPTLSKFAIDEIPVLRMGATSSMSEREFYHVMEERIQPRLSRIPGVGQVFLVGGTEREIKVNVDAEKLRGYGMSILQVSQAIKSANMDFPTGKIDDADGEFVVRVAGKFNSIEELRGLVVGRSRAGGEIRLADIAEVADGAAETKTMNRFNGKSSIGVLIQKQSDANAVEVSKKVRAEIAKVEGEFAANNVKFDIAQDGSTFTVDAANAVMFDLALAVALVAIVMLLFLHSFRNSFIVMIAIPASLISTFTVMWAFGFSLNLMTLLGLSLVVGILVDDSIVVLENIYRHLELGKPKREAALTGRNEIGFTALSITLVDVVVFLPLAMTGGLVGNILREFAVVVVASTLMSLFVSFTITPVFASRISKLEHMTKKTLMGRFGLWFERMYERLTDSYVGVLGWSIGRWWKGAIVLAGAFILFVSAFALVGMGYIGGEFITQSDRGEFSVQLDLPPGTTLEETNRVTHELERRVLEMPDVNKAFTSVGVSNEGLIGQTQSNASEINVALVPKKQRTRSTDEVGEEIKAIANSFPGVKARVNPIGIFGTANWSPVQVIVSGQNEQSAREAANMIADILRGIKGTADIRLSSEDGKPETRVQIDREKMASFGLTIAEVGGTLRIGLTGDDEAKFRESGDEYDIRVQLDEFDRARTADVAALTVMNRRGELIRLDQFATIDQTTGPTKLQRKDRNASITVFSQAYRPVGTIGDEFKSALATAKLPEGTIIGYDGDLRNQEDSGGPMMLAMAVGFLFVYLIMVALYNSYIYPLVVLFSIPLAMIGAFWALALTAKTLNIFSILGLIMLMGLVAKNAILLVDFANREREEGKSIKDALLASGRERLRPIIMTTLTMIFGMLPIAMATGAGAEWKSGLAWALVGGLTSSMVLTLVVVPVVYLLVATLRDAMARLVRRIFGRRIPAIELDGVPAETAVTADAVLPEGVLARNGESLSTVR
jgi:hydrophobic/amphiphilic exporter-1 (mainly G- bacteria), HAE1 family